MSFFLIIALISYIIYVSSAGCYQEGVLNIDWTKPSIKLVPSHNGSYSGNLSCSWKVNVSYPPSTVLSVIPNVGFDPTSTTPFNNINLTINNCKGENISKTVSLTQTSIKNEFIPYYFSDPEFCINFASPLTLNSPQYAYWNLTLALTSAPSSRVISMNTSIKIVDEYFGNYSTITFKADNGTLEFISNFNFTCNFCSYGIFYIYDSDNLNNLLYMSEASNLISTSYQHISLNRAITVLYVGSEYSDKTLTGYAVARVLEDNTKNCNLSNLLIVSNNLSSLEVFKSNDDGNCIGYLYVPSEVTIVIPLFIYKGSGNVTFSGSHDYESQFPLISLNNDMLNNYAYEFILNKGLYSLDIPPNSTLAFNYIINPGSFHTFDDKTYGIISSNGEPVHADIICQGCIANWAPVQIYDFNWLTNDISSLAFDCDGSASSFNGNKSLSSPYANMTITFPNNCTKLRLNTDGGVKFFFIYSAYKVADLPSSTMVSTTSTMVSSPITQGVDKVIEPITLIFSLIFVLIKIS